MRETLTESARPRIIPVAGGVLEYATISEGPAVLCLHGAMGGYDQGLLLARVIGPPDYYYVAISRPGYLGTPLATGKRPEEQADLCASLLNSLDIRKAFVMAISGGGPSALQFALRHRYRCPGLILISTCSGPIDAPIPFSFRMMKSMARFPGVVNLLRKKTMKDPEKAARRSIPDPTMRARVFDDLETAYLYRELMESTFDRMFLRVPGTENDIVVTRSVSYPLEEIRVPTLVVHGTADPHVPFEHAKTFKARVPGAALLAIEGGGHACIFTHRDQVKSHVSRFLAMNVRASSIL
jgi:pimeloyl-ACP methyl ester carboxylesterase